MFNIHKGLIWCEQGCSGGMSLEREAIKKCWIIKKYYDKSIVADTFNIGLAFDLFEYLLSYYRTVVFMVGSFYYTRHKYWLLTIADSINTKKDINTNNQ